MEWLDHKMVRFSIFRFDTGRRRPILELPFSGWGFSRKCVKFQQAVSGLDEMIRRLEQEAFFIFYFDQHDFSVGIVDSLGSILERRYSEKK
ncbi:hypothetical protein TNCV_4056751 [Trichonephila clavipes]|nr:hypothetical protein TNCV_4056751 [Trichonephila clavipes]